MERKTVLSVFSTISILPRQFGDHLVSVVGAGRAAAGHILQLGLGQVYQLGLQLQVASENMSLCPEHS